ncbi:MAG: agmatine deiminase family protein [Geobacteraceae bacterium]|nr:agmatine deiminase family protein [Geobacteraceae bacterium]
MTISNSYTDVRMPAEWEPQDAVLLAWPDPQGDWGPILAEIEGVMVEIIRHASAFEKIVIAAPDPHRPASVLRSSGISLENIHLYAVANNDTWARDFGPITVEADGNTVLYDFCFNGWGLKYPANLDNQINRSLAVQGAWKVPLQPQGLVLEGGSIESDGEGTLLTTAKCLLSPKRNPQLDKYAIEQRLRHTLGAKRILWLNQGSLAGDDTDGHIDTLARLCPQDTLVYVRCDDPTDEHFAPLRAMEEELQEFRTSTGAGYRLLPLPWPQPKFNPEHERLPATYANYLVINGAVLVPTYADPADPVALEVIASAYPEREIIGIDCSSVILQHGSLHCLTMQLPKGILA